VWTVIPTNNYYNICGLEAGTYRISITDSTGCESETYEFDIESRSDLTIENIILGDGFCEGSQGLTYVEVNTTDPNLTFFYNEVFVASTNLGDNLFELEIMESGLNGVLEVVNSQGCSDEAIISIQTIAETDIDFEFESTNNEPSGYIGVNSSIEFTNLSSIGSPVEYSYIVWDFDDNTPFKTFYNPTNLTPDENGENIETVFHTYTNDGVYEVSLTVFNSAGCSTSITKTIIVGQGASVLLPTVFTPNNDGINDVFRPLFGGISEISMYIYDNWGNLVYEYIADDTTVLDNDWGWDGIEPLNSEP